MINLLHFQVWLLILASIIGIWLTLWLVMKVESNVVNYGRNAIKRSGGQILLFAIQCISMQGSK